MVMRVVFCWVFVGLMGVVSVYADDGRADDGAFCNMDKECAKRGAAKRH